MNNVDKILEELAKEQPRNYDLSLNILELKKIIDKTVLQAKEEHLDSIQDELFKDELTSVYNKKYLNQKMLKNNCFNNSGVLVFIDLNKFKNINDVYGHLIGDKALIKFSKFLQENIRDEDKLIRYAGDEFLIIFNNKNIDSIQTKIEGINKKVLECNEVKNKFLISFSFGFSKFNKNDNIEDIIRIADNKMYLQKKSNL